MVRPFFDILIFSTNLYTEGENQVYVRNQFEYDRMQSIHEDIVAIERFHEIKDTTIDTFLYTVFAFEVFLTAFLAGMITKYYYIVHTIVSISIMEVTNVCF